MKEITHVFLDLDHTLWDFDKNAYLTLQALYTELDLQTKTGIVFEDFFATYQTINAELWKAYNHQAISQKELRQTRFIRVFQALGSDISHETNAVLSHEYVFRCARTGHLVEGAEQLLQYLQAKYIYHIITNGFNDTQWTKIEYSNLKHYLEPHQLTTSENAGANKPDKLIFEYTCQLYNVSPQRCIMIGDNLDTDIRGAKQSNIKSIWYAPHQNSKNELADIHITHLNQLIEIL